MKNTFCKLIALLLIVSMLLLPGCKPRIELSDGSVPTTVTPATITPATTQVPGTTAPDEKIPSVEITVQDAVLTYTMTEADVTAFYTLLTECEDIFINGKDVAVIEEKSELLDEKYAFMKEQLSIAMVLYYGDMTNEAASQLYLDCTETVTQANNDYQEMARRVYLSDSPHKDILFEGWTEEDFAYLMAYTQEVMEIQQRNSEIEVAYQDMQASETLYTDMVPLYIEMVQNNNRIAQIYGYDNYYEFAYKQVYDRDYSHDEIATMRGYVSQYLVPAISGALNQFNASFEQLNGWWQQILISFLYNSYTSNYEPYINYYLATLPEQMQADMLDMFNGNIVMKDKVEGAEEGAFTTAVGKDRLICYFGPDYSNALTIIHEVGHYYGGTHTSINDLPMDLMETQSQGNEWLFLYYLKNCMSEKVYQALVDYQMYSALANNIVCILVDEFEERVYTHENIASLTSRDLDAIMEDVCKAYGGIGSIKVNITDIQTYWRMVVIEQPVYYISYAVSSLAAMNLYTVASESYSDALEIYRLLNEEVDLEKGFLGNLSAAGLPGPFAEDVYKALYSRFVK